MANTKILYGPNSTVKFSNAEMIRHLGTTLDYTRRKNDRIILQNTNLEKEVLELKTVHINQDELRQEIVVLDNRVNCYKQLEIFLRDKITSLETKVGAYYNSCKQAKEMFNKQAVNRTIGVGYGYNEAIGLLDINSPDIVSAKERGIPHVLKGIEEPLFKKSIAEPLNENSFIIQEEMRIEDIALGNVVNNVSPVNNIKSKNVKPSKWVRKGSVKVVHITSPLKTDLGNPKVKNNNNSHNMNNMPTINTSHKAYGVVNCMSCAFNVMYAFFNSKHASNDKTAPRQHVNNKKHVKTKIASPPKVRKETYVPKPKQKIVKAVYRVKCSVPEEVIAVKIKNVVLPNKGQFFKYSGPNQIWVPKKD